MNRDFHLEAAIEKSNACQPRTTHNNVSVEEKTPVNELEPDTGKSSGLDPVVVLSKELERPRKKKKKKHKKHIFTEADFDFSGALKLSLLS